MKKYYITIVDLDTFTQHHLERDEKTVHSTVLRELGGYSNLKQSITSKDSDPEGDYCSTGFTIEGNKAYSIICVNV